MSSTRFARVKELFHQAVELEGDAREVFLEGACSEDAELRSELESLLASDARDLGLEQPVAEHAAELLAGGGLVEASPPPTAGAMPPGRCIGHYRLLHEIGRGGMSTVYLAVRDDDEYRQRVAIKLIRDGLESDDRRRRFLQERQILAGLDHPNIARLLDGGTTGEGLPYVVLEYVEGLPIDAFCDRHGLSVARRLELFRDVCSAVHAAHQNLVIHRDLKPGNVLITNRGVPKLLDFGIAKLLNPELSARDIRTTLPASRLMTPAYASPEQIRGEPVTTATDVYSLGVMLYELLTGQPPYRLAGAGRDEIARLVCETEPRPPSTVAAVRDLETGPEADGREQPPASRRRLSRDLDAIVLMALRKEPGRRYGSAEQLRDDLDRHRRNLPVRARRATFVYRAGKFLRRNRLVAALAAAAAVFSVAMTVQSVRLANALERAHDEEREARDQRDRAEQVSEFLVEVFRTSDPDAALGEKVTARELLDKASQRIDAELEEQPGLRATLMDTMGLAYQSLGFLDEAEALINGAFEVRRERAVGAETEVADSLSHLAFLNLVMEDFTVAETLGRQALAMRRELFGDHHPQVAESLHDLAETLFAAGRWQASEELYRQALAMRRQLLGPRHRAVAESLTEMSNLLRASGRLEEAEAMAGQALEVWRDLFGEEHPEVATALENLALARVDQGELEVGEELLRRALEIRRRLLGEEHSSVAVAAGELAEVLHRQGDSVAAEDLLREALQVSLGHWGADSPRVANHQGRLAAVVAARGELAEAVELRQQAFATYRQTFGPEHPWTVMQLSSLAHAVKATGDLDEAAGLYRDAARLWRRIQPQGSWDFAYVLVESGRLRSRGGDPSGAESVLRESVEMMHRVLPGHWRIAEAEAELGLCLALQGRLAEAEPLLAANLERWAEKRPEAAADLRRRLP